MRIRTDLFVAAVLAAVAPAAGQGIQPLDEARYREALSGDVPACRLDEPMRASIMTYDEEAAARHYAEFFPATGPGGAARPDEPSKGPVPLLAAAAAPAGAASDRLFRFFQDEWPYRTLLLSPYCDLSARASEAKRRGRPLVSEPFDPSAPQFVVIRVGPNTYFDKADSIKGMRLRRDGKVIEPVKTELVPQVVGVETRREILTGRFWFPVEAFASGSAVTLVYVGPARQWGWTFSEAELLTLQ